MPFLQSEVLEAADITMIYIRSRGLSFQSASTIAVREVFGSNISKEKFRKVKSAIGQNLRARRGQGKKNSKPKETTPKKVVSKVKEENLFQTEFSGIIPSQYH